MKAQVLLPKIFNFSFTYKTKKEKLTLGDIVEVPFGKEKAIGVVWPDKIFVSKDIKIKNIHKKIGKISLNKNFINFMKWFAMYNVTPLGLVLKMVIGGNQNLFIKNDKIFDQRVVKAKKFTNIDKLVDYFEDFKVKISKKNLNYLLKGVSNL